MRILGALLLLPLLLALPAAPAVSEDEKPPTGAGYAETELRLKTAGIDEAMREEIHRAIRRGVAVLRKQQFNHGGILGQAPQTVLGGLALAHAAIPDGREGAEKAKGYVMRYGRKAVAARTYEAGLACMLFESLERTGAEQKFLLRMHAALQRAPKSDMGYWGYKSSGGKPPPNLSTAQFACLGLWAAERAGAKPATKAWRLHLDTLLKAQLHNGSWGYYAPDAPEFVSLSTTGYATGTFMGLANVALAREALKEQIADEPEYDARVRIAVAKGKAALRRHAQWILTAQAMPGQLGHYPYYRLYALEKVCIFLDLEDVGGLAWYRIGARYLLDQQLPGGGWAAFMSPERQRALHAHRVKMQPSAQHTAFALLFLLRASAAYHPVTPRPIGRPKVVTPSGDTPTTGEADDAEPTKAAPPLVLAKGALARLEKALDGRRLMALRPVLDGMRLVGRIYRSSRGEEGFASPGHEAWARRVDDVMLRLATRFRTAKANDRLLWQAVALAALEALPDLHPRVGPRLMDAVLSMERDKAFPPGYRFGWYGTAMEALRRIDPPGLAPWLAARGVSDEILQGFRSSAAMTALGGLAPDLTGRQRHGAARAAFGRLDMLDRRSAGNLQVADLMRDVFVLMHRLAAPAGPDAELPPVGSLDPQESLEALRGWWRRHDDPDDPLWR